MCEFKGGGVWESGEVGFKGGDDGRHERVGIHTRIYHPGVKGCLRVCDQVAGQGHVTILRCGMGLIMRGKIMPLPPLHPSTIPKGFCLRLLQCTVIWMHAQPNCLQNGSYSEARNKGVLCAMFRSGPNQD